MLTDYFGGKGITKLLKANPKIKNPFKKKVVSEVVEDGRKTIQSISDFSKEQIEALIRYTGDDYINNSLCRMGTLSKGGNENV